ncbi:homeobox protein H2.0-like [Eriocheir sinensis]|uniref:homeobox protein H2.0-like n=1 Tax=Eriocheir sinensis TaxID=95602 RepID=UPI0021C6F4AC|nr:homeobox protein H2.0-like [Eriocheir sinensis]
MSGRNVLVHRRTFQNANQAQHHHHHHHQRGHQHHSPPPLRPDHTTTTTTNTRIGYSEGRGRECTQTPTVSYFCCLRPHHPCEGRPADPTLLGNAKKKNRSHS